MNNDELEIPNPPEPVEVTRFARIESGRVVNVEGLACHSEMPDAHLVESEHANAGDFYDEKTGEFRPPAEVRHAIVMDGVVTNITDILEGMNELAASLHAVPCDESVNIGDHLVGGKFVRPTPARIVPVSVPTLKLRKALARHGLDDAKVRALMVEFLQGEDQSDALVDWEFSPTTPSNGTLAQLLDVTGTKTPTEVEDLFILAETL